MSKCVQIVCTTRAKAHDLLGKISGVVGGSTHVENGATTLTHNYYTAHPLAGSYSSTYSKPLLFTRLYTLSTVPIKTIKNIK